MLKDWGVHKTDIVYIVCYLGINQRCLILSVKNSHFRLILRILKTGSIINLIFLSQVRHFLVLQHYQTLPREGKTNSADLRRGSKNIGAEDSDISHYHMILIRLWSLICICIYRSI